MLTVLGVFFSLASFVWIQALGRTSLQTNIETENIGFSITNDSRVEITFTVNVPQNTPVVCALQALNTNYTIVGWRIVEYQPSQKQVTTYTEPIRTIQPSTTAFVRSCWRA